VREPDGILRTQNNSDGTRYLVLCTVRRGRPDLDKSNTCPELGVDPRPLSWAPPPPLLPLLLLLAIGCSTGAASVTANQIFAFKNPAHLVTIFKQIANKNYLQLTGLLGGSSQGGALPLHLSARSRARALTLLLPLTPASRPPRS
jgi:hypothetical protein